MSTLYVGDKVRYKDEGKNGDKFTVLEVHGDTHVTLSLREYDDIEQDFTTSVDEIEKA